MLKNYEDIDKFLEKLERNFIQILKKWRFKRNLQKGTNKFPGYPKMFRTTSGRILKKLWLVQ